MTEIIISIHVIIVMVLLMFSIQKKRTVLNNAYLVPTSSLVLKGMAILLVFIHHFGQRASEIYYRYSCLGYLSVAIFFFIAGYAVETQFLRRGVGYIKTGFLKKKIFRLYLPYVIIVLLFALAGRHSVSETLLELIDIRQNWFFCVILGLYFAFF